MNILVTGCAGFIGFHLSEKLLNQNFNIYGLDNLNNFYEPTLKSSRLKILKRKKNFFFYKIDLNNKPKISNILKKNKIDIIINLAAQAGVRYSLSHPEEYFKTNVIGFYNLLDVCRDFKIKHFIFASTSSVYGSCEKFPIKESYDTDHPQSFYAATKKINETIAFSYSNIYKIPLTGLRFFTVYGPYGRPDMSIFKFVKNILNNKKIEVYNYGDHYRDFTYIDDVVEVIFRLLNKKPTGKIPFNVFNVGGGNDIYLKNLIKLIEKILGKKAKIEFKKKQIGDVYRTKASKNKLFKHIKFYPKINLEKGLELFTSWFKEYYGYK